MSRTTARRQRGVHRARDYDPEFGDADDDARKYRKSFVGRSRRARRLLKKFPALARVMDRVSTRTGALVVVIFMVFVMAASRRGSRARGSSMASSFGDAAEISRFREEEDAARLRRRFRAMSTPVRPWCDRPTASRKRRIGARGLVARVDRNSFRGLSIRRSSRGKRSQRETER